MDISPDAWIVFHIGPVPVSATIVFTWGVMALLVLSALLVRLRLSSSGELTRWQNLWEAVIDTMRAQIREVSGQEPGPYLPFVGTLFVFIAVSNILAVVPGYAAPTGSLSTTTALALCVLIAVPLFGLARRGLGGYLRSYIQPTPLMAPFNVIGEMSRTIALAIRLYGNVMSGTVIAGILISIAPFFFPVLMQLLGLLTGVIQAYIFAILAMVYIASATRGRAGAGAEKGNRHD
ncbi:F0F1 ATP synthase subunit A [Actibacterium sp. MT2.3-13A]|uniref:F0F1 ATP synthase subunit A n=1 Tax=Actibacterium sp. MT2.3-13A TaxID=2828332 RepID=UPI001BA7A3FE|nr:F0F1 ATP synthase subunit A [Actibacterium sp. MT2.3-13A]